MSSDIQTPAADIRKVVETAIGPFGSDGGAFSISGPEVALPSQDVVSLTLALHELATNAVKYGALSDSNGRVEVTWKDEGGKLLIEWKEHDGPPVHQPQRRGFGSRLLSRAAMRSDVQFEPDGIRCTIRAG